MKHIGLFSLAVFSAIFLHANASRSLSVISDVLMYLSRQEPKTRCDILAIGADPKQLHAISDLAANTSFVTLR